MALKYIGKGAWVPPYPARDLNDQEVKEFGGETALLATGLYETEKPVKRPENKPAKDGE